MRELAIGYARVSDPRQATEGSSIETQRQAIAEYCDRHELELVELVVEEGKSAKTADRKEFQRALTICRERAGEIQHLVVYQLSRWSRSNYDHSVLAYELETLGIRLRSVTEPFDASPSGRLVRDLLAVVAEYDNAQRGARVLHGMQDAAARGRWVWPPPLGYLPGSTVDSELSLVPDPERAPLLAEAMRRIATGAYSSAEVLRWATREGLRAARGGPISTSSWSHLLRQPTYRGRLVNDRWGLDEPGDWEALVDDVTWVRLQRALDARQRRRPRGTRAQHPDFPLRGLVSCAACEQPLTGSWSRGKLGKRYGYYHCPSRAKCGASRVARDRLHELWRQALDALAVPEEAIALLEAVVRDAWQERQGSAEERAAALEAELAQVERREAALLDLHLEGQVSRGAYEAKRRELAARSAELDAERIEARADLGLDLDRALTVAREILAAPGQLWEDTPPERRPKLEAALGVRTGVLYDDGAVRTPEGALFAAVRRIFVENSEMVGRPLLMFEPGQHEGLLMMLRPLSSLAAVPGGLPG